jgi:hypothetical protein
MIYPPGSLLSNKHSNRFYYITLQHKDNYNAIASVEVLQIYAEKNNDCIVCEPNCIACKFVVNTRDYQLVTDIDYIQHTRCNRSRVVFNKKDGSPRLAVFDYSERIYHLINWTGPDRYSTINGFELNKQYDSIPQKYKIKLPYTV